MSGLFNQFRTWYEKRHDYARDWKSRTGGRVAATMCTYVPEWIGARRPNVWPAAFEPSILFPEQPRSTAKRQSSCGERVP